MMAESMIGIQARKEREEVDAGHAYRMYSVDRVSTAPRCAAREEDARVSALMSATLEHKCPDNQSSKSSNPRSRA